MQHTATHCAQVCGGDGSDAPEIWQHTLTQYNTLQHTLTHCNTLQHTATPCNTLQYTVRRYVEGMEEMHRRYGVARAFVCTDDASIIDQLPAVNANRQVSSVHTNTQTDTN